MQHLNKCMFFHGVLIALISVCNYFIKINDAVAATCTTAQLNSCISKCGMLSVLSCVSSYGGSVSCTCGCNSAMLAEYGQVACDWAMRPGGSTCSAGGWCTFSHCATKDFYCFSFKMVNCDPHSHVKCRRIYPFDASATSNACSCRYVNSYTESKECYEYSYYGMSCESSCLSYRLPTGAYVWGKRNTLIPGGAITDCKVFVPAGCDSTGCYDAHECPYQK